MSDRLDELENWVDKNLAHKPNSQGLKEVKDLIKAVRYTVCHHSDLKLKINNAIDNIEAIKVGNSPKYIECKSNAIKLLHTVCQYSVLKY